MKPATNFLYVTLSSLIVNAVDFQVSLSVSLQNEGNSPTAKFTCSWTANTDTKVTYVAFHYWINSVYWKVRSVYACKVGLNFLSCDQGRFWDEQFGVESNKPDSINFTLSNLTTMENVTYYCSVLAFNNAYTAQATIENISETIITTTTLSKPETSPTDSPSLTWSDSMTSPTDSPSPTWSDSMTSPTDSPSSTWSDSMTSLRKSSKSETSLWIVAGIPCLIVIVVIVVVIIVCCCCKEKISQCCCKSNAGKVQPII
ncbi:uncharacterized protein LOC106073266 isoform X3 [Biomphalaria glabrata]|uniref:Uncharacterized protein LOC106073266 isoform X3 n=1 Tax=Biomphalaria glabrata TaxID=6526 RepID=A0A9W2YV43_BIOGL|nr:uncharacterized protein LOC106073266 isoform X3 [Biomphalaria glabrata]